MNPGITGNHNITSFILSPYYQYRLKVFHFTQDLQDFQKEKSVDPKGYSWMGIFS